MLLINCWRCSVIEMKQCFLLFDIDVHVLKLSVGYHSHFTTDLFVDIS